ncbi:MAG: biotin--[acetyl-CoA-carboxylase] ligase [Planctomycetota bacterium]
MDDWESLTNRCPGWHVEYHATLPSTNDRALALLAESTAELPRLVVAGEQTAGRGRGANRWWSASGAITASAVVAFPAGVSAERRPWLALVTGLAIREALSYWATHAVQVKWPNDVYLDGRKVSGILIETSASRLDRAVVGFGINVGNRLSAAPEEVRRRAVALVERSAVEMQPAEVLARCIQSLDRWLPKLAQRDWNLHADWQPHCLLAGRRVQLETAGRRVSGQCLGLDASGALRLLTDHGEQSFLSAVVLDW